MASNIWAEMEQAIPTCKCGRKRLIRCIEEGQPTTRYFETWCDNEDCELRDEIFEIRIEPTVQ